MKCSEGLVDELLLFYKLSQVQLISFFNISWLPKIVFVWPFTIAYTFNFCFLNISNTADFLHFCSVFLRHNVEFLCAAK